MATTVDTGNVRIWYECDEGSGVDLVDAVGTGSDLSDVNTVGTSSGTGPGSEDVKAYTPDDHHTVASESPHKLSLDSTLMIWTWNADHATDAGNYWIDNRKGGVGGYRFFIQGGSGNNLLRIQNSIGNLYISGSFGPTDSFWHMTLAEIDSGGTFRFSRDNSGWVAPGGESGTYAEGTGALFLGCNGFDASPNAFVTGRICKYAIIDAVDVDKSWLWENGNGRTYSEVPAPASGGEGPLVNGGPLTGGGVLRKGRLVGLDRRLVVPSRELISC